MLRGISFWFLCIASSCLSSKEGESDGYGVDPIRIRSFINFFKRPASGHRAYGQMLKRNPSQLAAQPSDSKGILKPEKKKHSRRFSGAAVEFHGKASKRGRWQGSGAMETPEKHVLWNPSQAPLSQLDMNLYEASDAPLPIVSGTFEHEETDESQHALPMMNDPQKHGEKRPNMRNNVKLEIGGECPFKKGECLNNRYTLIDPIKAGSYGQVYKAYDEKNKDEVAVKIMKYRTTFDKQVQKEIIILQLINDTARGRRCHVVKLKDNFVQDGHYCLVFELLYRDLRKLFRETECKGLSLQLTRNIGEQLVHGLFFLSSPPLSIIHCDLKPENIVLCKKRGAAIKIVDFGQSCFTGHGTSPHVGTPSYRAPEVILGLPYDTKADMWSLGCVLVEMHTGHRLFGGSTDSDEMAQMIEVLGMPPKAMLDRAPLTHVFFTRKEDGTYECRKAMGLKPGHRPLSDILGVNSGGPGGRRAHESGHKKQDYMKFKDLTERMLRYDPKRRITPEMALNHPFLNKTSH